MRQEHKPTDAMPEPADGVGAVSAFLLDRDALLPVVVSRLGGEATFESTIRGGSMAPAIPEHSRLRVQLLGTRAPEPGDILYYLADDGFVVHRLVHNLSDNRDEPCYLTIGDNCLAPDPPVPDRRVLGVVIEVETESGRRPPRSSRSVSAVHRIVRGVSIAMTAATARISVSGAAKLAIALRRLENMGRPGVGRVLRFVGLLRSR